MKKGVLKVKKVIFVILSFRAIEPYMKRQKKNFTASLNYVHLTGNMKLWKLDKYSIAMISNDFKWFQVISFDFRWFQMISDDFRWFRMISGDFRWFQVISGDFRWFQVISLISSDFKWFHWFQMISRDFGWFQVISRVWNQFVPPCDWSRKIISGKLKSSANILSISFSCSV